MPQIQVATYQFSSYRVKVATTAGGGSYLRLTPTDTSEGVSVVNIIYGLASVMYISGTEFYLYFAPLEARSHFAILRTEQPVFFEWFTDPAGLVTGAALKTGEEFAGEGEVDTS